MINVNITLYGDIAHYADGRHIATVDMELPEGAVIESVFNKLELPPSEKGYLFVNAVLYDAPGLYASRLEPLEDGDHIGIFSTRHMWPYQYRDGIQMSNSLKQAMKQQGSMRNTYREN